MRLTKWSSLLLVSLLLVGCGKKEIVGTGKFAAEARNVSAFTSVDISGYYNVNISVGQPQSVVIKVNSNLQPYIESVARGKQLTIKSKKGYLLRPQGIPEVDIVVPSLNQIDLSGNNNLVLTNYSGNSLALNFSGASQFSGQGVVNKLTIKASGNTSIDTEKLLANRVEIESNGYSKMAVYAKESLEVTIHGSAAINYLGDPKIKQVINGSGTITKQQETINK
jgi:hypothetical protein